MHFLFFSSAKVIPYLTFKFFLSKIRQDKLLSPVSIATSTKQDLGIKRRLLYLKTASIPYLPLAHSRPFLRFPDAFLRITIQLHLPEQMRSSSKSFIVLKQSPPWVILQSIDI